MPNFPVDIQAFSMVFESLGMFLCLVIALFLCIRLVDRGIKFKRRRPLGLWGLCLYLLSAAVYNLVAFLDYEAYRFAFDQLSEGLIKARYIVSVSLRCLTIILAINALYLRDLARKGIILLAIFTILTVYWKHPYFVFEKNAFMIEQTYFGDTIEELQYPLFPWIVLFAYVTLDLLVAGILIYYFTLPSIAALYKKDEQTTF